MDIKHWEAIVLFAITTNTINSYIIELAVDIEKLSINLNISLANFTKYVAHMNPQLLEVEVDLLTLLEESLEENQYEYNRLFKID